MKKVFATLFAATMLLAGSQAYAQVVVGAGYLASMENTKDNDKKVVDKTTYHGFYLGASYNFHFGASGFGVAPGFYLNMLMHNENSTSGNANLGISLMGNYTELALNIPVNFTYGYEINEDLKIMAFLGPNFQYGVMAKTNVRGTANILKYTVSDGEQYNHYDSKNGNRNPFNIYLGGGIGVQVGDVLFTVGYDHNLLDVDKYDNLRTGRNQIKAGVNFCF